MVLSYIFWNGISPQYLEHLNEIQCSHEEELQEDKNVIGFRTVHYIRSSSGFDC